MNWITAGNSRGNVKINNKGLCHLRATYCSLVVTDSHHLDLSFSNLVDRGLGMRLLLTVELNKLHVHKTSSKPIITLYSCSAALHWAKLVSSCCRKCHLVTDSQHARYTKGVKGWGERLQSTVKTPKFCVVNCQTVKNGWSKSWSRSQLWLQGIWEWPPSHLQFGYGITVILQATYLLLFAMHVSSCSLSAQSITQITLNYVRS